MPDSQPGIVSYGTYLPKYRLARADIGEALNALGGRGERG